MAIYLQILKYVTAMVIPYILLYLVPLSKLLIIPDYAQNSEEQLSMKEGE